MGYYTRVLSKKNDCPAYADLCAALRAKRSDVTLSLDDGQPDDWRSLLLSHAKGPEIAVVERSLVGEGSLASQEIAEFIDEVKRGKPDTAARWLVSFLKATRSVYAFQHLSGTEHKRGDEALRLVSEAIWARGDAILQADGEGFSNEDGYHILWQFSDRVSGPWWMAVLQGNRWVRFQIDLANRSHRAAFLEGRVPDGVATA